MSDSQTSLAELRQAVADFVAQRDWQPFHTPKNLAMSLAIEAAELMEHFQWLTGEESHAVGADPTRCAAIGEELADVLCYALALANVLAIDVSTAVRDKLAKNALKYPAEQFRGRWGHGDPAAPRT